MTAFYIFEFGLIDILIFIFVFTGEKVAIKAM